MSALTLIYLTAAHQARGDTKAASRYARNLMTDWPGYPVRGFLLGFYPRNNEPQMIIDLLVEAGWRD